MSSGFAITMVVVAMFLLIMLLMALYTVGNKEREIEALRTELSTVKSTAAKLYELLNRSQKINVALNEELSKAYRKTELSLLKNPPPDDMMRRLLMLCHPDRHNNSDASKKATQYLLSLRK